MGCNFLTTDSTDNFIKSDKKSQGKFKISGFSAILCGVLPLTLLIFLTAIGYLVSYGIIPYGNKAEIQNIILQIVYPLLGVFIGILLLFVLQFGIREWGRQAKLGNRLVIIAFFCLVINVIFNPIYYILSNSPATLDLDFVHIFIFLPNLSLLTSNVIQLISNPLLFILYLVTLSSALIYISAFGFLLIRLNGNCMTGNLLIPGLFYFAQLATCGSLLVGVEGESILGVGIILMLVGLLISVGCIFLGIRLLKPH
jgi:hypothetical protein